MLANHLFNGDALVHCRDHPALAVHGRGNGKREHVLDDHVRFFIIDVKIFSCIFKGRLGVAEAVHLANAVKASAVLLIIAPVLEKEVVQQRAPRHRDIVKAQLFGDEV